LIAFAAASAFAVGILAFYLSIYHVKGYVVPLGWDSSKYIWRTALARAVGITHLQEAVPPGIFGDPSRPGFVVVSGTLGSITRSSLFEMAAILPAVSAAAIGLAAGAFVRAILRRPVWEFAVATIAVGTSAFVIRLAGPETYQDNLFAAAVFMAAAIAIALAIDDLRAVLPAALLIGAGGIVHWAFFAFMLATLGLTALAYLPGSFRGWRSGSQVWNTASGRLALIAGGAVALAGGTLFGLLSSGPRSPKLQLPELIKKIDRSTPKYHFPITLPLAALGAVSLSSEPRLEERQTRLTRFALVFLLAWCGIVLLGYVALKVAHLAVPGDRFLAFALSVPILAVVGLLALTHLIADRNLALAAIFLGVVLIIVTALSLRLWQGTPLSISPPRIADATRLTSYLEAEQTDRDRPVIVIVPPGDGSYTALTGHMIRSVLPPDRIRNMYLYVGTVQNYLDRRSTPDPEIPARSALWRSYFNQMRGTYTHDPIVVLLRAFGTSTFRTWVAGHPGSIVNDGVAIVRGGPIPATPIRSSKPPPFGLREPRIGLVAMASLAILSVIGLGWMVLLLGRWLGPLELLALSPAAGIAALVPGGILMDRLGFRLVGAPAVVTAVIVAGLGWASTAFVTMREDAGEPPETLSPRRGRPSIDEPEDRGHVPTERSNPPRP
jgi:hypothetical protein